MGYGSDGQGPPSSVNFREIAHSILRLKAKENRRGGEVLRGRRGQGPDQGARGPRGGTRSRAIARQVKEKGFESSGTVTRRGKWTEEGQNLPG